MSPNPGQDLRREKLRRHAGLQELGSWEPGVCSRVKQLPILLWGFPVVRIIYDLPKQYVTGLHMTCLATYC